MRIPQGMGDGGVTGEEGWGLDFGMPIDRVIVMLPEGAT
jgi:hypothetical protein